MGWFAKMVTRILEKPGRISLQDPLNYFVVENADLSGYTQFFLYSRGLFHKNREKWKVGGK